MEEVKLKNSVEHEANNKPATSADIKAHITDKQKLIKKDTKVYCKQKKLSKIILN